MEQKDELNLPKVEASEKEITWEEVCRFGADLLRTTVLPEPLRTVIDLGIKDGER